MNLLHSYFLQLGNCFRLLCGSADNLPHILRWLVVLTKQSKKKKKSKKNDNVLQQSWYGCALRVKFAYKEFQLVVAICSDIVAKITDLDGLLRRGPILRLLFPFFLAVLPYL